MIMHINMMTEFVCGREGVFFVQSKGDGLQAYTMFEYICIDCVYGWVAV